MKNEEIRSSNWLTAGMAPEKLKTIKALSVISAEIYLRRRELGWDQKRFAKEMGVSQCMISKWESQEYNFTISTLIKICHKLNLDFCPEIRSKDIEQEAIAFSQIDDFSFDKNEFSTWEPSNGIVEGVA